MGILGKGDASDYSPIPDIQSSDTARESDHFIYDDHLRSPPRSPFAKSNRGRILIGLEGLISLLAYSAFLVTITSMWWKSERLHGASVVDTPIRKYIEYKPKFVGHTETSNDYGLVGKPSPELDRNWSKLMQYFYARVPPSYMQSLGRTKEGIRMADGDYLANYAFIHQLHCIKRLHQTYFTETYWPNMTEFEQELQLEHSLHCLQMLAEAIMCKADETPLTMIWFDNSILPGGNRTIAHECVDFDRLLEGMDEIKVDPFTPGLLNHPKFGPVVPGGRATILEDKVGYIFNPVPLDRNIWP